MEVVSFGETCCFHETKRYVYEKDLFYLHETKNYVYLFVLNKAKK